MNFLRNSKGITLPFALILTFIFSALVGVSYLFVSVNLLQMQSSLWSSQAIAVAEGINERIKARLNTKTKVQPSPQQEEKLQAGKEEEEGDLVGDEEEESDDLLAEEEFNEETEDFDEYYADEILKISRYITFREPPEGTQSENSGEGGSDDTENKAIKPEANVEMIGSIDIPPGTILNKGIMIVVYKDEKLDMKLKDIVPEKEGFRTKLPIPKIKALTPNYSEANKRSSFVVHGENLPHNPPRFSNKDIYIEDIKGGPTIEFLTSRDIKPGLTRFYWESAQAEFYIIPTFDGSIRPVINEIKNSDGNQLLDVKAGTRLVIMINGYDLYLKKSLPVVIPDTVGIIPQVTEQPASEKDITATLSLGKNVEAGVHSLIIATEGGLSNSWLFNVLPPSEEEVVSSNTATFTSSLTLLEIRAIENLLPLIDEEQASGQPQQSKTPPKKSQDKKQDNKKKKNEEPIPQEEPSEGQKLSPFSNTDLETAWLLETTAMVGKITKTLSEVIHRQVPNIHAAIVTNGSITFDGGGYQVTGKSTAMTILAEPTYVSNTILTVPGPPEEPEEPIEVPASGRAQEQKNPPQSPLELGFTPDTFVAVYKEGGRISDLDYGIIKNAGRNIIELFQPGLMDFHYQDDQVIQFIPPLISREKVSEDEAEKHIVPKDFAITRPNAASSINIFRSNIEQFSELADLYTNDASVPKDEFDLPLGYMGLTYIEGTPSFDQDNTLDGKGILVIDTRKDNQGRPTGDVEISGDSKNPAQFTGIVYVHGNLKIDGNVSINGALVVDNESRGQIQISNNSIGRISYDERAIRQTLLQTPFTTTPGTVMISNKPINLGDAVKSGTEAPKELGASSNVANTEGPKGAKPAEVPKAPEAPPEEALVETRPSIETLQVSPGSKPAEEELIDLF